MPRTVRTKVYKFNELDEKARQKAIEWYRSIDTEVAWSEENRQSMEKFAEIFPIKVTNWSYGGRGEGVSFMFETDHQEIEELDGQRLATYLWNNYRSEIYNRKYYQSWRSDHKIRHRKVNSTPKYEKIDGVLKETGEYWNVYRGESLVEYDCPLTGYFMDNVLLGEIWKFINKPDTRDFNELLADCFHEWIRACNGEIDYQYSEESVISNIEANEYEFTVDGKIFN